MTSAHVHYMPFTRRNNVMQHSMVWARFILVGLNLALPRERARHTGHLCTKFLGFPKVLFLALMNGVGKLRDFQFPRHCLYEDVYIHVCPCIYTYNTFIYTYIHVRDHFLDFAQVVLTLGLHFWNFVRVIWALGPTFGILSGPFGNTGSLLEFCPSRFDTRPHFWNFVRAI